MGNIGRMINAGMLKAGGSKGSLGGGGDFYKNKMAGNKGMNQGVGGAMMGPRHANRGIGAISRFASKRSMGGGRSCR